MARKTYSKKTFMKNRSKFASKFKPRVSRAVKKYVHRVVDAQPEVKFTQYEFDASLIDTTGNPSVLIYHPVQGVNAYSNVADLADTPSQRVGNQIEIKQVNLNWSMTVGDATNIVRIVFFQWLQETAEFPLFGDIFMGDSTGQPWLQPYNYVYRANYKILYDKVFTLSASAGNPAVIVKHLTIPASRLRIKKMKYTSNGQFGFAADVIKGNLYYAFMSDSSITPNPQINLTTRMLFTDA